jgi:hypothetical protein
MNSYLLVGMIQGDGILSSSLHAVADTMTENLAFDLVSEHMNGPPEQILVIQDDEVVAHYAYNDDDEEVVYINVDGKEDQ